MILAFTLGAFSAIDDIFQSGRDQDVAIIFQCIGVLCKIFALRKVQDRTGCLRCSKTASTSRPSSFLMAPSYSASNDLSAGLLEIFGGVVTYVSEALYNYFFTL
jgi:hypothetical protein